MNMLEVFEEYQALKKRCEVIALKHSRSNNTNKTLIAEEYQESMRRVLSVRLIIERYINTSDYAFIRLLLRCRYLEGMGYREIAKFLGCSFSLLSYYFRAFAESLQRGENGKALDQIIKDKELGKRGGKHDAIRTARKLQASAGA